MVLAMRTGLCFHTETYHSRSLGSGRVSSARGGLVQTLASFENGPARTGKRWAAALLLPHWGLVRRNPSGDARKAQPSPSAELRHPEHFRWA